MQQQGSCRNGGRKVEIQETILSEGDWVIVPYETRYIGFILKVFLTQRKYRIHFVRTNANNDYNAITSMDFEEVLPYKQSYEEDDLYQLMDLALDTKDEQWFNELHNRCPQALPF